MKSSLFFFSFIFSASLVNAAQKDLKQPLLALPFALPIGQAIDGTIPKATLAAPKDERPRSFQLVVAACTNNLAKVNALIAEDKDFDPTKCEVTLSGNLADVLEYMRQIDPRIIAFVSNGKPEPIAISSFNIRKSVKPVKRLLRKPKFKLQKNCELSLYRNGVLLDPATQGI